MCSCTLANVNNSLIHTLQATTVLDSLGGTGPQEPQTKSMIHAIGKEQFLLFTLTFSIVIDFSVNWSVLKWWWPMTVEKVLAHYLHAFVIVWKQFIAKSNLGWQPTVHNTITSLAFDNKRKHLVKMALPMNTGWFIENEQEWPRTSVHCCVWITYACHKTFQSSLLHIGIQMAWCRNHGHIQA